MVSDHRCSIHRAAFRILPILLALTFSVGCASIRITDPPRTATEQFLISGAVVASVQQLDLSPLMGHTVNFDTSNLSSIDDSFVKGQLRQALLEAGAELTTDTAHADLTVEARSAGVGIDRYDFFFGLPSLPIGSLVGAGGVESPEVPIIKFTRQYGYAGIAVSCYYNGSGKFLFGSGPNLGRCKRWDFWLVGAGPLSGGNMLQQAQKGARPEATAGTTEAPKPDEAATEKTDSELKTTQPKELGAMH